MFLRSRLVKIFQISFRLRRDKDLARAKDQCMSNRLDISSAMTSALSAFPDCISPSLAVLACRLSFTSCRSSHRSVPRPQMGRPLTRVGRVHAQTSRKQYISYFLFGLTLKMQVEHSLQVIRYRSCVQTISLAKNDSHFLNATG